MSQPKRHRKRVKMVLPIRVWGTDVVGKPFVCLAHTLDVTPDGARLGSFTVTVKLGERIGITRGMKKAHFRVAWIGQPSSPTEEQIGVELLDPERDIWGLQLPAAEPDDYRTQEIRDSPSAAVESPMLSADSGELGEYLHELAGQVRRTQNLIQQSSLPPAVVEEFCSASSQLRNASHIVERALEDRADPGDSYSLLVLLNRVQMVSSLCDALAKGLPAVRSMLPRHLLGELVQNVGSLFALAANFEVVDMSLSGADDDDKEMDNSPSADDSSASDSSVDEAWDSQGKGSAAGEATEAEFTTVMAPDDPQA